jgi:ferritin-like protein
MATPGITRRGLLACGVAGGIGAALGSFGQPEGAAADIPESDAQLLADLLAVEMLAVAVYQHVLATTLLSPRAQTVARKVLGQERAHAAAMGAELARLGQTPPVPPSDERQIAQQLSQRHVSRSLTDLHNEHDALDLLLDVEGVAEGAYYAAMSKLHRTPLIQLAAEILASEAQHEAVLGELRRGKDFSRAAPYAFVEGTH